jgi:hypothetical protein
MGLERDMTGDRKYREMVKQRERYREGGEGMRWLR